MPNARRAALPTSDSRPQANKSMRRQGKRATECAARLLARQDVPVHSTTDTQPGCGSLRRREVPAPECGLSSFTLRIVLGFSLPLIVNQPFEFVQLPFVHGVAIKQVHQQRRGRSPKRALEKMLCQATSDFIARYARLENKGPAALGVLDKSLSFHDAEQALYGFVIRRTARGEPADDVLDRAFSIFPQRTQYQKFRIGGCTRL